MTFYFNRPTVKSHRGRLPIEISLQVSVLPTFFRRKMSACATNQYFIYFVEQEKRLYNFVKSPKIKLIYKPQRVANLFGIGCKRHSEKDTSPYLLLGRFSL